MNINEARKKVKHCKDLLDEYNLINSTLNAIKRFKAEDITYKPDSVYIKNMKKRLVKIIETLNQLLK